MLLQLWYVLTWMHHHIWNAKIEINERRRHSLVFIHRIDENRPTSFVSQDAPEYSFIEVINSWFGHKQVEPWMWHLPQALGPEFQLCLVNPVQEIYVWKIDHIWLNHRHMIWFLWTFNSNQIKLRLPFRIFNFFLSINNFIISWKNFIKNISYNLLLWNCTWKEQILIERKSIKCCHSLYRNFNFKKYITIGLLYKVFRKIQ